MNKSDIYIDIMNGYYNYNSLADDVMNAFAEADEESFMEFCRNTIRDDFSCRKFIKNIEQNTYYEVPENFEMYNIVCEIYGSEVSKENIFLLWNSYNTVLSFTMDDGNKYSFYAQIEEGTTIFNDTYSEDGDKLYENNLYDFKLKVNGKFVDTLKDETSIDDFYEQILEAYINNCVENCSFQYIHPEIEHIKDCLNDKYPEKYIDIRNQSILSFKDNTKVDRPNIKSVSKQENIDR